METATTVAVAGGTRQASRPAAAPGRHPVSPRRRRPRRPAAVAIGLPWILPAMVLSIGLIYYCIVYTVYISTLDWNGTAPDPASVGLGNYLRALTDPVFWRALLNTTLFFVVTFTIQTALGMLFAVLFHSRIRLAVVYKVIIFVPVVIAPAVMAPVFREIYAPSGQLNWVLEHIGLGALAQPWIAQASTALPVIMSITIWEWTGLTFILYFAAMSQIDAEVLEAARIDGAGNLRTLVSIVWPSVRGTTLALAILSAIGALKTFDVPYLVTVGGPNYATEFLGTLIYRESIPQGNVGYGASLSVLLLVLALGVAIVLQATGRERQVRDV